MTRHNASQWSAAIARHFAQKKSTLWGQAFDLSDDVRRRQAMAFLLQEILAIQALMPPTFHQPSLRSPLDAELKRVDL